MTRVGLALLAAAAIAATGCASSGAVPRPFPGAMPTPATPAGAPAVQAPAVGDAAAPANAPAPAGHRLEPVALIDTALALRGTPYRNGGSDPSGFDCSGFVQYVFHQHGVALPRETREQFDVGAGVAAADVQPGDLVFFETVHAGPSHVGIVLDRDWFVHAPSSNGVVRVERYTGSYWSKRYLGARRVD
mgnify:CR=1 FL=1